MTSHSNIPIVDLSPFTTPDSTPESRHNAAQDLAQKLSKTGCIAIRGHGIPAEDLEKAIQVARDLFALPYEQKMKAPHPDGITPHRGYSGFGREKGAGKAASETTDAKEKEEILKTKDYKESYEVGSEENKVQYNIWLPEDVFPGFRAFATQFFWQLNRTASAILEALIMSLKLEDDEAKMVRALHTGHDNQLRLLHYPPVSHEMKLADKELSRLAAHTDWSSFTFSFQNTYGGLEFGDVGGDFTPAISTYKDGIIHMNIGDMFERISNGFYPSGRHRVVLPSSDDAAAKEEDTPARYSIPYFVMPTESGIIAPLPSRVSAEGKQRYEPMTFGEYADQMFQAVRTEIEVQ